MFIRFPSVTRSATTGYAIDTEAMFLSLNFRGRYIHPKLVEFETYGDGLCQHGPERPVSPENWLDLMVSLGSWLVANPADVEHVARFWPQEISRKAIEFATTVKYKDDGKTRYYSTREQKVSSSESKRYDTRWSKITEFQDGSSKSAIAILADETYDDLLHKFSLYLQIQAVYSHLDLWIGERAAKFFGISDDNQRSGRVEMAFNAIGSLVDAYRQHSYATGAIENLMERIQPEAAESVA